MGWILLSVAILANVATNLCLKKMATGIDLSESIVPLFVGVLTSIWFWAAAFSGVLLVGSYVLALKRIDLSASYAVVTSGALLLLTLYAVVGLGEHLSMLRGVGLVVIVAGIYLVTTN